MLRLRDDFDNEHFSGHRGDVKRIVQICLSRGHQLSYETAYKAWEQFSDSMAAGWMMLPDDDAEVFHTVMSYLTEDVE